MKKNKRKYLILLLLLLISIGFAYIFTETDIIGRLTGKGPSWNIYLTNPVILEGSVTGSEPVITDNTTLEYVAELVNPGEYFSFTVDVVNDGTIDGMISEIKNGLYNGDEKLDIPDCISIEMTYVDGAPLKQKQWLKAGETRTLLVTVTYLDNGIELEEDIDSTLRLEIEYVQDDGTSIKPQKQAICKRADLTQLHTETCAVVDKTGAQGCIWEGYKYNNTLGQFGYEYGDIITYGNTEIINGTLTPGDAFTCDINNDDIFDEETERFYYVSPYYDAENDEFNENYAAMIYYANVVDGEANFLDTTYTKYDTTEDVSSNGPTFAYLQLPKTNQWSDQLSLLNSTRTVVDEDKVYINKFTYEDRVARLLTIQEINRGCGITAGTATQGELIENCEYLLENSMYAYTKAVDGFWLENPASFHFKTEVLFDDVPSAWYVTGYSADVYARESAPTYGGVGVRPVLDIPIDRIEY